MIEQTMIRRMKQFINKNIQVVIAIAMIGLAVIFSAACSGLYYWTRSYLTLVIIWLIGSACSYSEGRVLLLRKNTYQLSPKRYQGTAQELAQKAGIKPSRLLMKQSTVMSAKTIGFGSLGVIVLSRALCEKLPNSQLKAVLAHELGHVKHHDRLVYTLLGLTLLDAIAVFSVTLTHTLHGGLGILFLLSCVAGICVLLLGTKYSRYAEQRADRFGVTLTGKPHDFSQALASMLASFTDKQGQTIHSDTPLWVRLLDTHPPLQQRIEEYGA